MIRNLHITFLMLLISLLIIFKAANEMSLRLFSYEFDIAALYVIVIVAILFTFVLPTEVTEQQKESVMKLGNKKLVIAILISVVIAYFVYLKVIRWPIAIEITSVSFIFSLLTTSLLLED